MLSTSEFNTRSYGVEVSARKLVPVLLDWVERIRDVESSIELGSLGIASLVAHDLAEELHALARGVTFLVAVFDESHQA